MVPTESQIEMVRMDPTSSDIPETGRGQFRVFWENRSFSETTRWIPLKNEILSVPGVIEVWLIFQSDRDTIL